jgi:hypothetical protein
MNELWRIGDDKIEGRAFYLKKFGYYGQKEFCPDYHIADYKHVEVVVSPYKNIK